MMFLMRAVVLSVVVVFLGSGRPMQADGVRADEDTETVRVFIFAGQSNMVGSDSKVRDIQRFPPFAGKSKRLVAQNVGAGDRRAPEPFDMLEDKIVTGEVIDEGFGSRVVHRVGHVAHQHDVLPLINHLANAEGPTEHAHVGVHAHDDDVFDAALLHQIKRFRTVGDRVASHDFQRVDLSLDVSNCRPDRTVVVARLTNGDRHGGFVFIVKMAPVLQRKFCFNLWCLLSKFPLRRVLILIHASAGRMNNENTLLASSLDDFVHSWSHLGERRCDSSGRSTCRR